MTRAEFYRKFTTEDWELLCSIEEFLDVFVEEPFIVEQAESVAMKIQRHQLVGANTDKDLETRVSNLITQGWQPFGSLAVIATADKGARYYQAMVLAENASVSG